MCEPEQEEMAAVGSSREERSSLAGTTALVTGDSRGIGCAIVEELVGFGARVHTCSQNAANMEECRLRWEEKKLPVTISVCDISVRAERELLMETVKETFDGKLDILVNNAGKIFSKTAAECLAEEYTHLMTTNLESIFHLSQLARPLLLNSSIVGGGSIINLSSIGGALGFPGLTVYWRRTWVPRPHSLWNDKRRNKPAYKEPSYRVGPRQDSCELRGSRCNHD